MPIAVSTCLILLLLAVLILTAWKFNKTSHMFCGNHGEYRKTFRL